MGKIATGSGSAETRHIPQSEANVAPAQGCEHIPALQPKRGLVSLDAIGRRWRASEHDPQFHFDELQRYAGGWVELTVALSVAERPCGTPMVYLDAGRHAPESTLIVLPQPSPDSSLATMIFPVPPNLQDAWFAPCSAPVEFTLAIRLRSLSKWQAMLRMTQAMVGSGRIRNLPAAFLPQWRSLHASALGNRAKGAFVEAYRSTVRGRSSTYHEWISLFEMAPTAYELLRIQRSDWDHLPLISVVMPTFNTPAIFLREAIESVLQQDYPQWELCIADDASSEPHVRHILEEFAARDSRIKVTFRASNGHISVASNSAIDLASGEFIALLDHDDKLHPLSLHYVAEAIIEHPSAEVIYSDEDKLDATGVRSSPYFKCEFNSELFLAQNMVSHLGCFRTATVKAIGGFRFGLEGSQDWDLAFRIVEKTGSANVFHIPRVLYHWRELPGSTSLSNEAKPYARQAGRQAVQDYLERQGIEATVTPAPELSSSNRVRYALPAALPNVSLIIPTRDKTDLLRVCIDSVLDRTTYANFEILVVDNGSVEAASHAYFESLPKQRVRVLRDDSPFNYSRLNNLAVEQSTGDFVCLLNNDVEVINAEWLDEMVSIACQPTVGIVGARLWYPDYRLQHAGVVLGIGGVAGHVHRLLPRGDRGYFGRAVLSQQMSAVTGACLLISRTLWDALGGLDEDLAVTFNDIDLCLRAGRLGYRTIWTPYAELIHHESVSRGADNTPAKLARARAEQMMMTDRWGESLRHDPFYSPNLTLLADDYSLSWDPRLT
jgi:glycosyltransferase involved in cell wall biosynthesis